VAIASGGLKRLLYVAQPGLAWQVATLQAGQRLTARRAPE